MLLQTPSESMWVLQVVMFIGFQTQTMILTGIMTVTIGTHDLYVGKGVVIPDNSFLLHV